MKWIRREQGTVMSGALVAGVIVAVLSTMSVVMVPLFQGSSAEMWVTPDTGVYGAGDTFELTVMVSAQVPVNVFKGDIRFDPTVLAVDAITYNTSIADLWAEKPWYENGAGTINFIGGTTRTGGFMGTDALMTITLRAIGVGSSPLHFEDVRILAHDGFGTDVVVGEPIDALFSVAKEQTVAAETVAAPDSTTGTVIVAIERPHTDLNDDGKQTIADTSIFMLHLFSDDTRYDFTGDGVVDTKDLSVLMSAQ